MDFLENEFGIKEGQTYQITYENDRREVYHIEKCLILNFYPQQIVAKSDKGLHIFKPRYITEMKPLIIKTKESKLTLKEFEDNIIGEEAGIVDINLIPLHIGDSVSLYIDNEYNGERVIAGYRGNAFVMGCGGTKIVGGVGELLTDKFIKIKLFKSYKEFKAGDKIDTIEFIKV